MSFPSSIYLSAIRKKLLGFTDRQNSVTGDVCVSEYRCVCVRVFECACMCVCEGF